MNYKNKHSSMQVAIIFILGIMPIIHLCSETTQEDTPKDTTIQKVESSFGFIGAVQVSLATALDMPFRGANIALIAGIYYLHWSAQARAGIAYSLGTGIFDCRLDLLVGLGPGINVFVGGFIPFGVATLGHQNSKATIKADFWLSRYGLSISLFTFPIPAIYSDASLGAEILYTSYRYAEGEVSSLSGASAFAAAIEINVLFKLTWGGYKPLHRGLSLK